MSYLKPTDEELLGPYMRGVGYFLQELGPGLSTASGLLLCQVILTEGATMGELAARVGISKYAATRALRTLTGLTLVDCVHNGREKHCYLTPRGRTFRDRFLRQGRENVVRVRKAATRRHGAEPR